MAEGTERAQRALTIAITAAAALVFVLAVGGWMLKCGDSCAAGDVQPDKWNVHKGSWQWGGRVAVTACGVAAAIASVWMFEAGRRVGALLAGVLSLTATAAYFYFPW